MNDVVSILKALCGKNKTLFNEVSDELKEAISFEITDGIRTANTEAVVKLAMRLECSQYPDETYNRERICKLLSKNSEHPELIEKLLGKEGVDIRGDHNAV